MKYINPNPTNTAFVYLLIKDHEVIYVGQTQFPEQRFKVHESKDYDHYVIFPCFGFWGIERRFIQFHNPPLNIVSKVNHHNGRPLKKLVEGDLGDALMEQIRPFDTVLKAKRVKENRVKSDRKFGRLVVALEPKKETA